MSMFVHKLLGRGDQVQDTPESAPIPPGTGIRLTPSSDERPSTPRHTPSSDTARKIRAFKGITNILAQLQPKQTLEQEPPSVFELSKMDRREARIADAFAHLAIADHEVVAIATKRSPEVLTILACVHPFDDKATPKTVPSNVKPRPWSILFTGNYRKDDHHHETTVPDPTVPTIVEPSEPKDLATRPIELYLDDLMEHWKKPTLSSHLWILSKFLVRRGPSINLLENEYRLSKYTIAMCHRKMLKRLTHPLSLSYIAFLKNVTNVSFKNELPGTRETTKNELAEDRAFLQEFVVRVKGTPAMISTKIPNIICVLDNLPEEGPCQLYTSDTCMEFHNLLLELMARFEEDLKKLQTGVEKAEKAGSAPFDINNLLSFISLTGSTLARLVRGRAFQMHLQNIEKLLVDIRSSPVMATSMPLPGATKDEEEDTKRDEAAESERDEELEAIQSVVITPGGTRMALWMTYRDWFRLMVVHFDAATTVFNYVSTQHAFPHDSISIKILVPPPVDTTCLTLPELLADSTLFPEGDPNGPSNKEIDSFFADAFQSISATKKYFDQSRSALDACRESNFRRAKDILTNLTNLTKEKALDFQPFQSAQDIRDQCILWCRIKPANAEERKEAGDAIFNKVQLFYNLCKEEYESALLPASNFQKIKPFSGTLHCEACLVSLLDQRTRNILAQDDRYKEILEATEGFGRVIGVSKRCCPACQIFLSGFLVGGARVVARGYHTTVSSLTLPPWTLEEHVDSMNLAFGTMLRRELLRLMDKQQFKKRTPSMNSQRLSIDSLDWQITRISPGPGPGIDDAISRGYARPRD